MFDLLEGFRSWDFNSKQQIEAAAYGRGCARGDDHAWRANDSAPLSDQSPGEIREAGYSAPGPDFPAHRIFRPHGRIFRPVVCSLKIAAEKFVLQRG